MDYDKLEKLMREMVLNQYRIRTLEIQSKLLLSHFNKFKLFRLHHSIPFKLTPLEPKSATAQTEQTAEFSENVNSENEEESNRITEEGSILSNQDVYFRAPTCVPAAVTCKQRWDSKELELLHDVWSGRSESASMKSLYDAFKQKCMQTDIPFRTFKAFAHKVTRL